jgi:hypothetical protein
LENVVAKILVTLGIVFYAVVIPILEVNGTHVFNPEWPSHARLHEVWQLATNTSMGIFALWLIWFRDEIWLPALFTFFIFGGFLFSYFTGQLYGGSMVLSDGSEKTLLGMNLGMFAGALAIAFAAVALDLDRRARNERLKES